MDMPPEVREQVQRNMTDLGIDPDAVARTIAVAIEQPRGVEIGEIVVRPPARLSPITHRG
ncbi:hypothetical protein [Streptomyces coryli]|uniref:hypothetical protein n=1 Tax=Streptomyces coryli TaxID=1128680 RepID=UPI0019CFF35D|nr:hypothetical protein [Streptomyces coryli]